MPRRVDPLHLHLLGIDVIVRASTVQMRELLGDLWAPFKAAAGPQGAAEIVIRDSGGSWDVEVLGRDRFETDDLWDLLDRVSSGLFQYVVLMGEGFLDIHAAVLAREELTVLVTGAPGAGKTTLTLEMLTSPKVSGWFYMSDDLAPIEVSSGQVWAFPKPLSIKDAERWPDLGKGWKGAGGLVAPTSTFPVPASGFPHLADTKRSVSHIVFPNREKGPPALDRVAPGLATYRLGCFVSSERMGPQALVLLAELCGRVPCFDLVYEEVEQGLALLEEAIETTA